MEGAHGASAPTVPARTPSLTCEGWPQHHAPARALHVAARGWLVPGTLGGVGRGNIFALSPHLARVNGEVAVGAMATAQHLRDMQG